MFSCGTKDGGVLTLIINSWHTGRNFTRDTKMPKKKATYHCRWKINRNKAGLANTDIMFRKSDEPRGDAGRSGGSGVSTELSSLILK